MECNNSERIKMKRLIYLRITKKVQFGGHLYMGLNYKILKGILGHISRRIALKTVWHTGWSKTKDLKTSEKKVNKI